MQGPGTRDVQGWLIQELGMGLPDTLQTLVHISWCTNTPKLLMKMTPVLLHTSNLHVLMHRLNGVAESYHCCEA